MSARGGSTWFLGRRGIPKRLPGYITRDAAYWSYLMRHRLSQILSGRLPKALLPILIQKTSALSSVHRLGSTDGSTNVFLVSATPRNGVQSRSIVVKCRLPIRTNSTRGSQRTAKTPTSLEYVFEGSSPVRVRWNLYQPKSSKPQRSQSLPLNPTIRL